MSEILILYSTSEGHTGKIANRIKAQIQECGHDADVVCLSDKPKGFSLQNYKVLIIGSSIHIGRHQKSMMKFVRRNLDKIKSIPSAFYSVCLTASRTGEEYQNIIKGYIDNFKKKTGMQPFLTESFAGALLYRKYGFIKRFIMRKISEKGGGDTDTSRDYEYTDPERIKEFVKHFLAGAGLD